jgi:hypothetical protein
MGCVHRPPAGLGGLHQLEHHGQGGTAAAGALGPKPHGGEGRLDRVVVRRWVQCRCWVNGSGGAGPRSRYPGGVVTSALECP